MSNGDNNNDQRATDVTASYSREGGFPTDRAAGATAQLGAARSGQTEVPVRDEWTPLAAELLDILAGPEFGPEMPVSPPRTTEQSPLVPASPLCSVLPTAAMPVEPLVLPAHVVEARDASHSELTKALLKLVGKGRFARRHAFDLHPESTDGRISRYDVEANQRILSSLVLPEPATLPPSSVERDDALAQAGRAPDAEVPGPEVRRGEPVRLADAVRANFEMLAIVLAATDENVIEAPLVTPNPLGRPRLPGEPVAETPDGSPATVGPSSDQATSFEKRPIRTGEEMAR